MASFLDTLFGGGAQKDAAAQNAAALSQYGNTANAALTTGYNTGTGDLNSAIGAYSPLAGLGTTYSSVAPTLTNALGVNGPQGNIAAGAAFQNSPGYTQAVTAATDAINRRAGTSGMFNSGNAAEDVGNFVQNTQNQQYNNWLQNLQQVGGMGLNATGAAASGQATGYGNLANLAQTYAGNQAGVAGNITSGTMADNNMVAAGEASGAKNLLGAGLSLASLGLGGVGGLGGLGSALSSGASSMFGSAMGQPWQAANPGSFGSSFYGPVAPQ